MLREFLHILRTCQSGRQRFAGYVGIANSWRWVETLGAFLSLIGSAADLRGAQRSVIHCEWGERAEIERIGTRLMLRRTGQSLHRSATCSATYRSCGPIGECGGAVGSNGSSSAGALFVRLEPTSPYEAVSRWRSSSSDVVQGRCTHERCR